MKSSSSSAALRGRRAGLAAGIVAAVVLALPGCSVTPARRAGAGGGPDADADEPDDLDLAAAGAGSEIVMQALANVGKPYRWGGSNPGDGFDCSGLVAHVYDDAVGIKLPRTSRQMSRSGKGIEKSRLAAGDLVFFNTLRRPYSHVGIYIGRGRFVHAPSAGSLVRVERMTHRYWASRYDGARRLVTPSQTNQSNQTNRTIGSSQGS